MTAQITHKTIITNTLTNEVTVLRHDFSDYKQLVSLWDEYAHAVLQNNVDALSSIDELRAEIVTN